MLPWKVVMVFYKYRTQKERLIVEYCPNDNIIISFMNILLWA